MAPARSRSLAIVACCALSSPALGQALPSLRVDPALLGLPPVKPAAPATPVAPVAPAATPEEDRRRETPGVAPAPASRPAEAARAVPAPAMPTSRPEAVADVDREAAPDPGLRLTATLTRLPAGSAEPRPSFITADRMQGVSDHESVAEGDVELRKIGTVVNADRLVYRHIDDEIEAEGNVRLRREQSLVTGPKLRLRMEDQVGFIEQPVYSLRREPPLGALKRQATEAQGRATKIEFQGENQFQLSDATYSTCKPGDDSWFVKIAGLHLDYDREVGEGRNAAVYFKGLPIMYSPWLSFSLNNQRKSGLLPPTVGSTSQSGLEVTLPYYWNIAPNMDATLVPRIFTKRGTQLGTEFRYLTAPYSGQAQVEWLPGDKVRNSDRWAYSVQHNQTLGYGFAGNLNVNGVSDDFYYKDLSSRITNSAQTQLIRQGSVSYGGAWWSASGQVLKYQTLQSDPANLVARPYEITPQLALSARRSFFDLADFSLLGQYTDFSHPDPATLQARRAVLYPQVAVPYITPAFYVSPKLGAHLTRYRFDRPLANGETAFNRSVPIASVDAGLTFERSDNVFGRSFTQTLEPRLYYLYVPNRDQSLLTNNAVSFDTGITDFNFAQIFSENIYTGQDRIADANQLTTALTTRFLNPDTGGEFFKAMVGQRLYFDSQSVTLNPGDARRTARKTDLLAAATGQITPRTYVDAAWQYNPRDARTERFNLGGRYLPEPGRVLNAAYRFSRDQAAPFAVSVKQIDVSGQWPLFGGWQAVGRYNYSINESRVIETIGGLEYNSGCWAARAVVQRFATTATTSTSAVFLQLELSDFSQIGSNPLELLKRNIPGYGRADQPAADPVFGSQ